MFDLLIHLYYKESWDDYLKNTINSLLVFKCNIFINICSETDYHKEITKTIKEDCPLAFVLASPNIGKDIGGKLLLIDFWMQMNMKSDFLVFIHDKKSPHTITGEQWRKTLYKIVNTENIKKIISLFEKKKSIGLIGSKEFLISEYDEKLMTSFSNNLNEITQLQQQYSLYPKNHKFIAGTMFWIRSCIIKNFFMLNPALICRQDLEKGNVQDLDTGTKTHAWERLFCWLVTCQGYKLKGI